MASLERHHTVLRWAQECGRVMVLRLLWLRVVIVSDPALASQVFSRKAEANKPAIISLSNPLISAKGHPGLFSATDSQSPYWRTVRKGTASAFNPHNLSIIWSAVIGSAGPGRVVDIDDLLIREALDLIGMVGFNHDFQAVQGFLSQTHGDAFYHANRGLEEITLRIANPLRKYLTFLPSVREGERHFLAFQAHMEHLLRTIKARGPPADDDVSLAAHLLRLRDPFTGGPLPVERLLPEIATFFIAGFEARVCQELEEHGLLATPANPAPRLVEYEDLSKLAFLSACVRESMRLLPVTAEAASRCSPHDVSLGGYTIPANTWIWTYFFAIHRSSANWEDPNVYQPERWLQPGTEYYTPPSAQTTSTTNLAPAGPETFDISVETGSGSLTEAAGGKRSAYEAVGGVNAAPAALPPAERALRYLPFSTGPRDCVGQNLARMNYMATLAVLLGRFSFRLAPGMEGPGGVQEAIKLTLQQASGIPMLCMPRA
ncbi:hypothetical protein N2152v2_002834 [Parachlorella kessleri]